MVEEEGGASATWWLPWKRCTSTTTRDWLATRLVQARVVLVAAGDVGEDGGGADGATTFVLDNGGITVAQEWKVERMAT